MIGKSLRCWLVIYEKTLPLDLEACNKCHYSGFWMPLMHGRCVCGAGGNQMENKTSMQFAAGSPLGMQPQNNHPCKSTSKLPQWTQIRSFYFSVGDLET